LSHFHREAFFVEKQQAETYKFSSVGYVRQIIVVVIIVVVVGIERAFPTVLLLILLAFFFFVVVVFVGDHFLRYLRRQRR